MPAYKDKKGNSWYAKFNYKNWKGETKFTTKRGFPTKRAAVEYEREFKLHIAGDLDMNFEEFVKLYREDLYPRIRVSTAATKDHIINTKLIPYFKNFKVTEIKAKDIVKWQNELLSYRNPETGKPYMKTYLKTVHNQMNAIMNFAVKYYDLKDNPVEKAGSIGISNAEEMKFWVLDEYLQFSEAMMEEPFFYYCFEVLYWCGLREGDDDDKIRLNQRKPSKYKGLSRFGPEKNLQRINKFMKERPTFYKKLIQMKENFRFYLRCFYCITKVVILQFNSEKQDRISS